MTRASDAPWYLIETGKPASSERSGSLPCANKYLRRALPNIAIKTSLTVPPKNLPSSWILLSGKVVVINHRRLVNSLFKILCGAEKGNCGRSFFPLKKSRPKFANIEDASGTALDCFTNA